MSLQTYRKLQGQLEENRLNIEKRLNKHNNNEGAKFTKGSIWQLIYFKKYKDKKIAMRDEYKLKKDYKLRSKLKTNYINK